MKNIIELSQSEIDNAIREYVEKQLGKSVYVMDINIVLSDSFHMPGYSAMLTVAGSPKSVA